ncbi:hypothetical protein [Delftia tsuruhatensis]|uniref:hypothetical protein n=1 Tax=Delftia tsuruhatensis TaxID=180282 RepID=UPI00062D016C|nr:hypothetical protein [Delftia tsuruhatensis]
MSNSNAFPSPCPLCGQTAKTFSEHYDTRYHYFCPNCRELKVHKLVSDSLRQAPAEVREALSAQARALREGEYLNFTRDFDQPMQGQHRSPWRAEVRTRPV